MKISMRKGVQKQIEFQPKLEIFIEIYMTAAIHVGNMFKCQNRFSIEGRKKKDSQLHHWFNYKYFNYSFDWW